MNSSLCGCLPSSSIWAVVVWVGSVLVVLSEFVAIITMLSTKKGIVINAHPLVIGLVNLRPQWGQVLTFLAIMPPHSGQLLSLLFCSLVGSAGCSGAGLGFGGSSGILHVGQVVRLGANFFLHFGQVFKSIFLSSGWFIGFSASVLR